jgi:hypothetical protein
MEGLEGFVDTGDNRQVRRSTTKRITMEAARKASSGCRETNNIGGSKG